MPRPDLPLRTDRLLLRGHRETDLDDLLVFHSDPGVTRFTPWPVRDRDQTREALAKRLPQTHLDRAGDVLCLAVEHRADRRVIGEVILFWHSEADRQGEIGYALASAYHRQGLAAEACTPVLDWAFDHLGLHRVSATAIAANRASTAVLARLGFRHEGTFRDAVAFEGGWAEDVVWAITAPEWRARPRPPAAPPTPPAAPPTPPAAPPTPAAALITRFGRPPERATGTEPRDRRRWGRP